MIFAAIPVLIVNGVSQNGFHGYFVELKMGDPSFVSYFSPLNRVTPLECLRMMYVLLIRQLNIIEYINFIKSDFTKFIIYLIADLIRHAF